MCVFLIHFPDSQIQGQPGRDGQGHHAVQQVQEHVPGGGRRLRAQPGAQQVSGRAAAARRGQEGGAKEGGASQGEQPR